MKQEKEKKYFFKYRGRTIATSLIFIFFAVFMFTSQVLPEDLLSKRTSRLQSRGVRRGLAKKISLNLRDMDIVDVLRFLAKKGDLNIITSGNVIGQATLILNDVSIGDVMEIALIANGLAYAIKNNIIYVMSGEEYLNKYGKRFSRDLEVKVVKFSYVKPSYAFSVLESLKSQLGKIIVDESGGLVVLVDTPEHLAKMEAAIANMEYKLDTRIFDLKYAQAEEIEAILKGSLDAQNVGTAQADKRSNQIVVKALPQRLKEAGQLIRTLDKKTRQVVIEAKIFKVILNPKFDIGINWEKAFSKSASEVLRNLSIVGSFPISTDISSAATLGTVGKFEMGDLVSDEFTIELKALKQVSDVKTLATPSITVTNNKEATIHIGDKLAYVVSSTTQSDSTATTAESVSFVDVGIQLTVTPAINEDGFVTMKIAPEISSQTGEYTAPSGSKIPLVNTTRAETTVMVKDGITVILGGLRKEEKSYSLKGFPFLMDIPVLGRLFCMESESTTNSEIVIALTPHIISGDVNTTKILPQIKSYEKY